MNSINQYRYYDLIVQNPNDSVLDIKNDTNAIISIKNDTFYELINEKNIKQIGIQSLPGSKFYFNEPKFPIIIGNTGYFEIGLDAKITIGAVYIDNDTRNLITNNPAAMIIIDTIEEKGGN